MSRRFLGRVGWPSVFFLVAGLVFAGLGWVTYAALGVERAQREAAARAELGNNLRVALWRLDGRMLPALGVEDSRPFYHYESADPAGLYGPAATPLLVAGLPDWMRLHFQLDPVTGWYSSQAPSDRGEIERVNEAWGDIGLPNFRNGREKVLSEIRAKYPVRTTCELFAARDRAIPADSLPFAAPLFTEVDSSPRDPGTSISLPPESLPKPPPPIDPVTLKTDDAGKDVYRVLGFEVCQSAVEQFQYEQFSQMQQRAENDIQKKNEPPRAGPRAQTLIQNNVAQNNVAMRGGANSGKNAETDRAWLEYLQRARSFGKSLEEVKNAYDGSLSRNPGQGNYQNFDNKFQGQAAGLAGKNDVFPPIVLAPTAGSVGSPAGQNPLPSPGAPKLAPNPNKETATGALRQIEAEARLLGVVGGEALRSARPELEKRSAELATNPRSPADAEAEFGWLLRQEDRKATHLDLMDGEAKSVWKSMPLGPVGEDRPAMPNIPLSTPHSVHLGSMRPQWVTGRDGTETLMLVRAARLEFKNSQDNRTVYQGILIDWPKLEAKLKEEVKDLYPDARLVAVHNPEGVSPDRAMTALPVQLDPGPDASLASAGWTPLRIGLSLAWVAAIIAIVAVGFSGWTLIDLAERRIRFVSAVTHELRTPLTSLRLYLDLLVSGMIQDEDKRQEYLNTLATESERLHRLIDNVLDFAKLEKRRKNGDIKPVKLNELTSQLRDTWTDRLAQDDKELVVISTLPAECEVATDSAMIQQIVGNLIDNARKYTRDAEDKRIWLWAKPGTGKSVFLEVEDRGPGVAASERRTIFKPFRRGETAETTAGGAGLGLALAKSWAEVLGARLSYRPAEGGIGACFRLELPGK